MTYSATIMTDQRGYVVRIAGPSHGAIPDVRVYRSKHEAQEACAQIGAIQVSDEESDTQQLYTARAIANARLGLIQSYDDGNALILTTSSPASHYGIPVLRHDGCTACADMGPADTIPLCAEGQGVIEIFGQRTAAEAVHKEAVRWPADLQAQAAKFLSQWPAGGLTSPLTPRSRHDDERY